MEQIKSLFIFDVTTTEHDYQFEFLGDILEEVSAFGDTEQDARAILKKEFGAFLEKQCVLTRVETRTLFGKAPDKNSVYSQSDLY
jgi:hypothetical protein